MRQPAGTYAEADLERIIARDFAQDSIPAVKALLSRYGKESWQREVLRVQPAEYPTYDQARTPQAKQKAIESDWKQLQAWLNRKERAPR